MNDVKTVIGLLCNHICQIIDSTLKPGHFRSAKYNKQSRSTANEFWKVLYQLSRYTWINIPENIQSLHHDQITFVKLYFAYHQYPSVQFYALSSNDSSDNRELLIALGWLLATQNASNVGIERKISQSPLAEEFSRTITTNASHTRQHISKAVEDYAKSYKSCSLDDQLDNIVYTCGKISYNLKTISELIAEQIKSMTKVHVASTNVCGLPHLTVSEMSFVRRTALKKVNNADLERMREMQELATAIETHGKWSNKQHVFFDWMNTVLEEHQKSEKEMLCENSRYELEQFVGLLRDIIEKRLLNPRPNTSSAAANSFHLQGERGSRFLRTESRDNDAGLYLSEMKRSLVAEEQAAEKTANRLSMHLKSMIKSIPNCIQVK